MHMPEVELFTPGRIGALEVPNRIIMAPMTRNRALARGVPSELAIQYYSQRSAAGLQITEGTAPCAGGIGYIRTPAIETPAQITAWKRITDAVTAGGGRMFLQLMHVGRISHPLNRYTDQPIVAPSSVKAAGQIWTDAQALQDFTTPHALATREVAGVIESYAQATRNAFAAGFKGVELHAASGYLPMQFLSSNTNQRTDAYGGGVKRRIRFVLDTLDAMSAAAGSSEKVGVKISPALTFNDIHDGDPVETYTTLVKALTGRKLAYLHVQQTALAGTFELLRPLYPGTFIASGGFGRDTGNAALASGLADYIAYAKPFIANPDLPARFARNAPIRAADPATFYSPGPNGYTEFPFEQA